MKKLSFLSKVQGEYNYFNANFSENQMLAKEMWKVRGGDGGEDVIIIPEPPDKPQ